MGSFNKCAKQRQEGGGGEKYRRMGERERELFWEGAL